MRLNNCLHATYLWRSRKVKRILSPGLRVPKGMWNALARRAPAQASSCQKVCGTLSVDAHQLRPSRAKKYVERSRSTLQALSCRKVLGSLLVEAPGLLTLKSMWIALGRGSRPSHAEKYVDRSLSTRKLKLNLFFVSFHSELGY